MCFNTVIINPRGNDVTNILEETKSFMIRNNDGFSLWAWWKDGRNILVRTLNEKEILDAFNTVKTANIIHLHYRLASSGSKSIENVHMWDIAGFYVSHNGFVGRYVASYDILGDGVGILTSDKVTEAKVDTEVKSDTYQFVHSIDFINALKKMNLKTLAKIAQEKSFFGVLFATNPKFTLVMSRGKSAKVTVLNDVIVFSNDWYAHGFVNLYGIDFNIEKEIENAIILYDNEALRIVNTEPVRHMLPYSRNTTGNVSDNCNACDIDYFDYFESVDTTKIRLNRKGRSRRKSRRNKNESDFDDEYWKWLWWENNDDFEL